MNAILDLVGQLLRDEEEVLHAYPDSLGFWTIGVGHLIDSRKGGGIPQSISRQLLALDIERAQTQLSETFPWTDALDAVRRGALVNMTFQMGIRGLGQFHGMLQALQQGDYVGAAVAGLDSIWARAQTPARAHRLMQQIQTGVWQ